MSDSLDASSSRRTVLKGAAVGAVGAATLLRQPIPAWASVRPTAVLLDLGAAKYGAKGEGGDDSAALLSWQRDIVTAIAAGASGVHATVPCGVFAISRRGAPRGLGVLADNVHVEGASRTGTVLTQLPGTNADIVHTPGNASGRGPASSGFSLSSLTIDANAPNQGRLCWCCLIRGYNYDIDNVDLLRGAAGGLSSTFTDPGVRYMEARVHGLGVHEYSGLRGVFEPTYGILWRGPHDSHFSDITISTLSAVEPNTARGAPSYGFVQVGPAAGEYLSNVHIWGRNHFGLWADPSASGIHLANVVAEGAFVANAVLSSGSTWAGGEAYGTWGQAGQAQEVGISLGFGGASGILPHRAGATPSFRCNNAHITGVHVFRFRHPGACFDLTHSAGSNIVQATCWTGDDDSSAALHRGAANPADELVLVGSGSNASLIRRLANT